MNNQTFSIQKLASLLIVICLVVYILIVGKTILIPLFFAAMFAFMLKPISGKIERHVKNRPASIILTFIIALTPIIMLIAFFSLQFVDVFQNMSSISEQIQNGVNNVFNKINAQFGFSKADGEEMLSLTLF